jgi:eukaryotic-like serine/threonine-protein kinase
LDEQRRLGAEPSPEELCPDDPALCERLRQRVAARKRLEVHLGLDEDDSVRAVPAVPDGPPRIPGITIEAEIGRGVMGVVYRGLQEGLGRPVAVKVILGGAYTVSRDRARFRTEAIATARIPHPNIVAIHDSGESPGLPYLVLEYLGGGSLADRLHGEPQPPRWAAALVRTLAGAVAAAHARGVIHRDLKPRSIVFASDGTPKITDYGLAKLLDFDLGHTLTGQSTGTPSYMATEQAGLTPYSIGPPTDVYALGAILYELLTGGPPFRGPTALDTLELVRTQDPVAPGGLQPKTPRDLETICLKCLEKDPGLRYCTAEELAEDLGRFLGGGPIRGRPVSSPEKLRRWARRHPIAASLTTSLVTLLILISVGAFVVARKEHGLRLMVEQTEHREAARSERLRYLQHIALADRALSGNMVDRVDELLAQCPARLRNWEWHYLNRQRHGVRRVLSAHAARITALAFSNDGRRLASSDWVKTVRIWDVPSGQLLQTLTMDANKVAAVVFSPDGRRVAAVCEDQTLRVWETAGGHVVFTVRASAGKTFGLAYSPDGSRIAAAGDDGIVRVWDGATGSEVTTLKDLAQESLNSVAYSPDGARVAASGSRGTVCVWDTTTAQPVMKRRHPHGGRSCPPEPAWSSRVHQHSDLQSRGLADRVGQ